MLFLSLYNHLCFPGTHANLSMVNFAKLSLILLFRLGRVGKKVSWGLSLLQNLIGES